MIKRIAPDAEVIDITHGIAPHNVLQGALVLASTVPFMHEGIHLAVVDPGVGSDRRAIALPIFPSRAFRLDGIYLRADGDVTAPRDLVGRRVGISDYERTAALWQRGILMHEHGVRPEDLTWLQSSPLAARPPNVPLNRCPVTARRPSSRAR